MPREFISPALKDLLNSLQFREDAERKTCDVIGSIHWEDEMPNPADLQKVSDRDRGTMYILFWIRNQLWDAQPLNPSQQQWWDEARSDVPDWALFRRLKLSADDRAAKEEIYRQILQEVEDACGAANDLKGSPKKR